MTIELVTGACVSCLLICDPLSPSEASSARSLKRTKASHLVYFYPKTYRRS